MKIPQEILNKAQENKDWANRVLNDSEWMANACNMSKEMAHRYNTQTVEQISIHLWNDLKRRGNATRKYYGDTIYIDKPARERYLKLLK